MGKSMITTLNKWCKAKDSGGLVRGDYYTYKIISRRMATLVSRRHDGPSCQRRDCRETSWSSSGGFCASWYFDVCFTRHCSSVGSELTKEQYTWFQSLAKALNCLNLVVQSFISRRVAVCTARVSVYKLGEVTAVSDIIYWQFGQFHHCLNVASGDQQWKFILASFCSLVLTLWMVDKDNCINPRATPATASAQAGMGRKIQFWC